MFTLRRLVSGALKLVFGGEASAGDQIQPVPMGSERLSVIGPAGQVVTPVTVGKLGTSQRGARVGVIVTHRDDAGTARFGHGWYSVYVEDEAMGQQFGAELRCTGSTGDVGVATCLPNYKTIWGKGSSSKPGLHSCIDVGHMVMDDTTGNRVFNCYRNLVPNTGVAGHEDCRMAGPSVPERVATRRSHGKSGNWRSAATANAYQAMSVCEGGALVEYLRMDGGSGCVEFKRPAKLSTYETLPQAGNNGRMAMYGGLPCWDNGTAWVRADGSPVE